MEVVPPTGASVSGARPEAGLSALRARLYEVLHASSALGDQGLRRSLLPTLRKIEIAHLLDEQYVVAITGLQGVGKTTLIRSLYGIPQGVLPCTQGRGELLPIWVVEDDALAPGDHSGIRAELVEIGSGEGGVPLALVTRPLPLDEVERCAMEPGPYHFLLKLHVPPLFFRGTARSFLLLPGIEHEDTAWVLLARHALACSDAAVFVANDTTWSRARTQRELERVKDALRGSRPVLALSFTDQSTDGNRTLTETVMRDLEIPEDEADRIVCTSHQPAAVDGWAGRLRGALDRYAATTQAGRIRQLRHLEQVLDEEVHAALAEAENVASRAMVSLDVKEHRQVTLTLETLEREIKGLRRSYAAALDRELDAYAGRARESFEHAILDKGLFRRMKESVFGENLKTRQRLRSAIQQAWTKPRGDALDRLHGRVLNKTAAPRLSRYGVLATPEGPNALSRRDLLGLLPPKEQASDDYLFGGSQTVVRGRREFNAGVLHDTHLLLVHGAGGKFTGDLKNNVKALPSLALESVRIGAHVPELFDLEACAFAPQDQLRYVGEEFEALRKGHSDILKGAGLMLGLDYAGDGDFDIIEGLLTKAGMNAAAASPIAFAVVGAVAVGYAGVSAAAALNRAELDEASRGYSAIGELQDRTREQFLEAFDRLMDELVEHVRTRLGSYYRLDQQFAQSARLSKALADARDAQHRLESRIHPLLLA